MRKTEAVADENESRAYRRRGSEALIRGIEREIDELHVLNAWLRWREVIAFAGVYTAGALSVANARGMAALILFGVICMGVALNSLGILIHEGLHGLLAKNSRTNRFCSFLVGLPLCISATAYQVTHSNHHFELGRKLDYGTYRQHVQKPFMVWVAYFVQLLLGTVVYMACIPFLAFRSASAGSRLHILLEYAIILLCCWLLFRCTSLDVLLMYWLYPLVVMSVLTNIRGLASHALGDVQNIYLSSRTITSSRLVSFLFLHENHHLEHHLFPGIPSYHLRNAHKLIWNRLPEALHSRSYSRFLVDFFKAAIRNELRPMGVVRPAGKVTA